MTSPPIKSRAWRRDRVGAGVDAQATVRGQRPNVSRIVLAVIGSGTSMAPAGAGSPLGKRLGTSVAWASASAIWWAVSGPRQLVREEPGVALVARHRGRRQAVGLGNGDRADQVAQVELAGDEMARQGVEQLGMNRRVGPAHVVGRIDQSLAEELGPDPVGRGPGEVGVVRRPSSRRPAPCAGLRRRRPSRPCRRAAAARPAVLVRR